MVAAGCCMTWRAAHRGASLGLLLFAPGHHPGLARVAASVAAHGHEVGGLLAHPRKHDECGSCYMRLSVVVSMTQGTPIAAHPMPVVILGLGEYRFHSQADK